MRIYSQKDGEWGGKTFSSSHLKMSSWGCVVTAVAQALTAAGWNVTPGQLVDQLNDINGFTDDGLLIWGKVTQLYPQFHFGGKGFQFVNGTFGRMSHWILVDEKGNAYEPYEGQEGEPTSFKRTGTIRTASIDRNVPAPQPDPTPAPAPAPQPKQDLSYTVKKGDNLTKICRNAYNLNAKDGYAKALEVAKYNGIADANKISVGQVIKLPA